jgi:hypothetical protein
VGKERGREVGYLQKHSSPSIYTRIYTRHTQYFFLISDEVELLALNNRAAASTAPNTLHTSTKKEKLKHHILYTKQYI